MTQATTKDYWISPRALFIELNAMGNPDYIQASCVSGAQILVYVKGVIDYDAGHNYRRWTLQAFPTVFNTHSKKYVYVAIPRTESADNTAYFVFPSEEIDIYGKNAKEEQVGSVNYYYVFLQGVISSSGDNGTVNRGWNPQFSTGYLSSDEAIAALPNDSEWYKFLPVDNTVTFLKDITMKAGTVFKEFFAKTLTIVSGGKITFENQGELEGVADSTTPVSSINRAVTPKYLDDNALSSVNDDTAQGLITFSKGLVAKAVAEFQNGLHSIDYDNAAEQGFSIEKDAGGRYQAFLTNLTVWGKALFHELEVRKLSYAGGNIYLSGAGSKIVKAVPVKKVTATNGTETTVTWEACEVTDTDCAGWKCYLLADDGTTATMNYWQEGDQVRCQTMGEIAAGGTYADASNKSYWRTIPDNGVSTQNEKIYGTKTETYLDEDGNEQTREVQVELYDGQAFAWIVIGKHSEGIDGYETEDEAPTETKGIPAEGDTIVLDGNRHRNSHQEYDKTDRQNVIVLETTGDYAPRIACFANITEYKHTFEKTVNGEKKEVSLSVFETSPKGGTKINSSRFEWISDDGSTINIINYRGDWVSTNKYHKNDQVNHNNAVWVCVANSGVDVEGEEPRDKSTVWKKVLSGGTSYGVTLTVEKRTISSVEDDCLVVTFTKGDTDGVTTTNNVQDIGGYAQLYVDGKIDTSATARLNLGTSEAGELQKGAYPQVFTAGYVTVKWYDKEGGTLLGMGSLTRGADGKQGDGVVMAYKHADTQPDAPTGTDPEYPGDGWSLSPDATTTGEKVTDVSYGDYESGAYDGTNKGTDATAKEWAEAEDDGRTWMKSPSGLSVNYGYALMKVSFTTQYDNTTVDVEIKAYSEQNFDFVEVWALDTAPDTGTTFRGQGLAHASGNGVEQAYSFTVAKAGRHFICVTYAKDISGNDNGDYGLFRLDLSDNEAAVSDTVWMSQAKVSGGKCVLPWSTPVKINGADGIGAFEILCDPETIVIDTDDNGLATGLDNAYASLMCMRDGKEVSGVTYKKDLCMNCGATVNTDTGVVTITSVRKQSVTVDGQTVEVSCTSGSVTVNVTDPTTKTTYVKTIPFAVNVAKFNGGLKADNKTLRSQYSELSKNSATKDDLKEYDSKIEQTARNISLKVMEKSVGRRNLLPGSAFRKQGEGCSIVQDGQDAINGICINGGYDGVNCARLRNEGNAGAAFPRVSWDGGRNSNVKVAKGKKYTLSFWAKRLSATEGGYEISTQFFLQNGANGSDRPYHALKMGSFTVKSQGEWEFIQDTVTIPSDAKSNYVEVCICLALYQSGMAEILVCRPMLEEGDEYNGWTLSEQDYDYVGGNLLDNAGTLTKTGNVEVLDGTVTQGGMGESASIKAELPPTVKEVDFLQYSTSGMGLKANEDYTLSFYAKTEGNAGKLQCYLYPSDGGINTEDSESGYDNSWYPSDGDLRSEIVPGTRWKRYWVHWRPQKNDPKHVLFRLARGGNDRGTYSSYTTYAVDDVVLYDGTYYRCIKAGQGNTPSSSSSYWDATKYQISLSQPKLEVGATVTEWTAKRSDMVDKQALYATGIDIDSKTIILTAKTTKFRDNDGNEQAVIDGNGLRAGTITTTDNGGGHTEISGNSTVWYNKDGVTPGIKVFYDAAGVPHFQFCNSNGKVMYDFGPSGLQSFISSTQQAYSDECYLRDASSGVSTSGTKLSFDWLYVARNQSADKRFVWRKQIPTTEASSLYEIYDGCVFTKEYYNTANSVNWPKPAYLLPDGWYVEPNDGNLPMKIRPADDEGVFDPTQTVYYQTFYYYSSGKVTRTVRAYMKRTTSSQLVLKFTYAGSYDEI